MADSTTPDAKQLLASKCVPCEGGVPVLSKEVATERLRAVPSWKLDEEAKSISLKLNCGNFVAAVSTINVVSEIAESQQHHPDLHLTGYRHLKIVLTTHAIGGLSENDLIVAAHIDRAINEKD
ncbi:MAG: 4a-hydroxytetrahydrobiopterin dehydratase [Planctomycetota bacterium]